jgi:membrane-associated phospholipid phosphatase
MQGRDDSYSKVRNGRLRVGWALLAVVGVLSFCGLVAEGVTIRPWPLVVSLAPIAAVLGVSVFYTYCRANPRIATMAIGAAFLLTMGATMAPLTYLAATFGGSLCDPQFVAVERAMGFNWPASAEALTKNPVLIWLLTAAYSLIQLAVVVVGLPLVDLPQRLTTFLLLQLGSLAITIALSVLFPAVGPGNTYEISSELYSRLGGPGKDFLTDYSALRQGAFQTFDMSKLQGIVVFPSFHCVLAVLTVWALAPLRWLGPASIVLNVLVVISTIPVGGHYISDIVAGLLIAGAAVAFVTRPRPPVSKFALSGKLIFNHIHRAQ